MKSLGCISIGGYRRVVRNELEGAGAPRAEGGTPGMTLN